MSLLDALLRRWERRTALSEADREALLALPFQQRGCIRDSYLVREGEQTASCHLLISGFAYRQKIVSTGARQILSIHIPGEFVDLQNGLLGVADHNVQCLNRAETLVFAKADLLRVFTEHPALGHAAWVDTVIDASLFREWTVNVGRRDAKTRIAHLLCEQIARQAAAGLGTRDSCEFPMTQEQVADATGLTPVHTNRTLQALRKAGLINLSASQLTVLDWPGLVDLGDFNDRYLHLSE